MKKPLKIALIALLCVVLVTGVVFAGLAIARAVEIDRIGDIAVVGGYKNVILLIGDGMGFNHIAAGRASLGVDELFMESAAVIAGEATTYSRTIIGPTDSAAAATALATGQKTDNGMIAQYLGKDLKSNTEYAMEQGMATGIIASEGVKGATPAGFSAHAFSRNSTDEITRDQMSSGIDLFLGGAKDFYDDYAGDIAASGYDYATAASALDPAAQGTGGSSSGYNFSQSAAINLRPAEAGSVATPLMYCAMGFYTLTPLTALGDSATFTGGFYNYGFGTCNLTLGIKVVCPNGDSLYLASDYSAEVPSNYGYSDFEMSLEGFPTETGRYLVYPAYRDENDGRWHDIRSNITEGKTHLIAIVEEQYILLLTPDAPVESAEAANVSLISTPYAGENFQVKATITNNGSGEYIDEVFAAIVAVGGTEILSNSNPIAVDILGGDATELTFTLPAPEGTGSYELVIASLNANTMLSERLPITVTEAPSGSLSFSMARPLTVSNANNVTADDLHFSASITCNSGFYGNQIFAYVFPEDGDDNVGYLTTDLYIGEGETRNVTLSGSIEGLEVGRTYTASLYYLIAGYYLQAISQSSNNIATFTVGALTPVDGISDDAQPHDISVYNLAGRCLLRQHATTADLSQLAPGTYIIKANGKTKKVVKN